MAATSESAKQPIVKHIDRAHNRASSSLTLRTDGKRGLRTTETSNSCCASSQLRYAPRQKRRLGSVNAALGCDIPRYVRSGHRSPVISIRQNCTQLRTSTFSAVKVCWPRRRRQTMVSTFFKQDKLCASRHVSFGRPVNLVSRACSRAQRPQVSKVRVCDRQQSHRLHECNTHVL